MDRQTLFERERQAWERINRALEGLGEVDMVAPGVIANWTVKDILAHIATWQERAFRSIRSLAAGERIETIEDFDGLNAADYERNKALPLAEARARFEANRARLVALLQTMSEEQLFGRRLISLWVSNSSYRHLEEHAEAIELWRARRGPQGPAGSV